MQRCVRSAKCRKCVRALISLPVLNPMEFCGGENWALRLCCCLSVCMKSVCYRLSYGAYTGTQVYICNVLCLKLKKKKANDNKNIYFYFLNIIFFLFLKRKLWCPVDPVWLNVADMLPVLAPFTGDSITRRMSIPVKLWQNSLCEKTCWIKAVSILIGIFIPVLN